MLENGQYSPQLIDHFRNPRHPGVLPAGCGVSVAQADTPGSKALMQLSLRVSDGVIREARFLAHGCPATIAAGSWLCEWLQQRTCVEAGALTAPAIVKALGLAPVKRHCAVLAEDALRAALSGFASD